MEINIGGIDLYENIGDDDDEFKKEEEEVAAAAAEEAAAQRANFDASVVEDLYDDVISSSNTNDDGSHVDRAVEAQPQSHVVSGARYHGKRVAMYIGNLTWWTTDDDLLNRVAALGVHDIVEIKFHENRQNGQSKGFCVMVFGSDQSARTVQEKLTKLEIHGQSPVVTPCNKQSLNYFEQQAGGSRGGGGGGGGDDSYGGGGSGGSSGDGGSGGGHYQHQGGQYQSHGSSQMVPHGTRLPPGGPMGMQPPRGSSVGPPHMGGPPPMGLPPVSMQGMPHHHMRPPPSQMGNFAPRPNSGQFPSNHPAAVAAAAAAAAAAQVYQNRIPVDPRLLTPNNMSRGPVQSTSVPPQQHMFLPQHSGHPAVPAAPAGTQPPLQHSMVAAQHPQPHVNPAFLTAGGQAAVINNAPSNAAPGGGLASSSGAFPGQHAPSANTAAPQHLQAGAVDIYGRPLHTPTYPNASVQPQDTVIGLSEKDVEEILNRNKTVSSSAISRAVQDAAAGDYASAIETLVTAISLIRQSKIASDDRCKILINSLQDTLHGIETKSYGSNAKSSSSRRRRSYSDSGSDGGDVDGGGGGGGGARGSRHSRERGRSGSRNRSEKRRRSRERDSYRERSRERDYYSSRNNDRRDHYTRH